MRIFLTIAAAWVALSIPAALAVGRAMGRMSRQIGAALSNYQVEVEFRRLTDPIEREIDARHGGAW